MPAALRTPVKAGLTGKPFTLIGIEYIRRSIAADRLFQGIHTEVRVHTVGYLPRQDLATVPVHNRHHVHKALGHGDVAQIRRPDLVRTVYAHAPQKVGVDPVSLARPTGVGLWIEGGNPHQLHQVLYLLAIDRAPQILQIIPNPATAIERAFEMDLVDQPHQSQIIIRHSHRLVIHRGAIEIQQLTLAGHLQ